MVGETDCLQNRTVKIGTSRQTCEACSTQDQDVVLPPRSQNTPNPGNPGLTPPPRHPPTQPTSSKQSECLLRLGKPAEAAASASRGLQLFDNSFTHGLAYCTLRLGTARLLSGEVEEATHLIGEGALLAARIRSARLTNEVKTARSRMEPWKDTSAVKALDERLMGMGFGGENR